jgi:hypothetical protein
MNLAFFEPTSNLPESHKAKDITTMLTTIVRTEANVASKFCHSPKVRNAIGG